MNDVVRLIFRRLGLGIITLFAVSIFIFSAVEMLPGDLAQQILGQAATEETLEALRRELKLDRPALARYFGWLGNALRGDFGISLTNQRSVGAQLAPRFANTLFLAGLSAAIAVPVAISIGVLAAWFRETLFDRIANVSVLAAISSPEFFVGYVLILVFSVQNPWFPSISNVSPDTEFFQRVYRTILPALTLTFVVTAHIMRMTRSAIINLLASPYIEMARLKGLRPGRVIIHHALPNALAPIINVVALNVAYLVTGVVLVEVVFVYPGVGQLLVDSVAKRDFPVVQACCLIFAATYILLNLTADVLVILTNPRLRYPK